MDPARPPDADVRAAEPSSEEVLLAFLERHRADVEAGRPRTLAHYLAIWPRHQEDVAREYLAASGAPDRGAAWPCPGGEADAMFGPYRLAREIGRGGQGVVYLAEDTRNARTLALKVLLRLGPDAGARMRRFRREAEITSGLDHPGICTVVDAGIEDRLPYIAMPHLAGETLAVGIARARRSAPEPGSPFALRCPIHVAAMLAAFAQAARALHAAHEAGVLHRDLKPGNIMIGPGGAPVIFDFGLAGLLDPGDAASLTQSGDLVGTPAYMSPEQIATARPRRLDCRSDVYSLAVTLYECLTLRPAFAAPTREALFQAILTHVPPEPRRLNPAIPKDLGTVLATALEKEPDRRYQTAEAFAADLIAVREHRAIVARRVGATRRALRWAQREPVQAALLLTLLVSLPTIAALATARIKDRPHVAAARRALAEEERDALLTEGSHELTEGNADAAADFYRRALALPGACPEAAGGLVLVQLRRKDPGAALAELVAHADLLRDCGATAHLRAEALRMLGRPAEADAAAEGARPPSTALDHQILAVAALRDCEHATRAELERALRHATAAILASPQPRLQLFDLRLHAAGHLRQREAVLDTADVLEQRWPASPRGRYRCGWALKMLDDRALLGRAVADLRASIALRHDQVLAHNVLGNCLSDTGEFEAAFAAFATSIRLAPTRPDTRTNLAIALSRAGRHEDALVESRAAVAADASHADARAVLGICLQQTGHEAEAADAYEAALRLRPDLPAARQNLAGILARRGEALGAAGRVDDAVTTYRRALALQGNDAATHNNLANLLVVLERYEEARAELDEAIRLDPELAEPHCALVGVLLARNEVEAAVAAARQAIRLAPELPEAHAALAQALIASGLEAEAAAACRDALRLGAEGALMHAVLGLACATAGCLDEAIVAWTEAMRLDPKNGTTLCNLATALRDTGHLQAARRTLDAAAGSTPPTARALPCPDLVAELDALLRAEEALAARLAGHLAAGSAPESIDERLTLARCAFDHDRIDLAARWYRHALDSAPGLLAGLRDDEVRRAIAAAARMSEVGDPSERADWRTCALVWLRAELRRVSERVQAGTLDRRGARLALRPFAAREEFAPLRNSGELARLPARDRNDWQQAWQELEALAPPLLPPPAPPR